MEAALAGVEVPAPLLEAAFEEVVRGDAPPVATAGLLIALRAKGESVAEMATIARVLRAHAETAPLGRPDALDTCGTGGDGSGTFNVSTVAAFVVAGARVPVAKHGNRAASSKAGSADVLEALGVNVDLPVERSAAILAECGIAFFFARRAHPAFRHLAPVRAELGVRTVMNAMGPLLNPLGVRRQLVGVYSAELVEPLARVLAELGCERSLVVHGDDGLDEITTTAGSDAALQIGSEVIRLRIEPEQLGIERALPEALLGGDAATNAQIARAILAGEAGAPRDLVLANAAGALLVADVAEDLRGAFEVARTSLDSGAAAAKLDALVRATAA
jgi:anthranilate phosphoribosyltransferase